MARLLSHLILYVAVNAFLVAVWLLTVGSIDELQQVVRDPGEATIVGFWPVWPILVWGTALAIHAGVAIPNVLFGRRAVRHRRRMARDAAKVGKDVVREVGQVIDRASVRHERRRREVPSGAPPAPSAPELEDKGLRELKGLSQPRHLLAVVWSQRS